MMIPWRRQKWDKVGVRSGQKAHLNRVLHGELIILNELQHLFPSPDTSWQYKLCCCLFECYGRGGGTEEQEGSNTGTREVD